MFCALLPTPPPPRQWRPLLIPKREKTHRSLNYPFPENEIDREREIYVKEKKNS